jgi:hypothetical protein
MVDVIAQKLAEVLGVVFLHTAIQHVVTDRETLQTALEQSVFFRSRKLRISMAQILSIKVDDRFLLISNLRRPERATPIGGVVRYFPSEIHRLEGDFGFQHEFGEGDERYDLRGFLMGKHFVSFLKWYAAGSGCEQCALAREIEEEFEEIGIPEITTFIKRPEFVKERAIHEGPTRVNDRDYWQYRYFEVLSLREESKVSGLLAEFIRSQAGNHHIALVSTEDVRRGRLQDGRIIGDSAGYLFSDSAHGIEAPPLF